MAPVPGRRWPSDIPFNTINSAGGAPLVRGGFTCEAKAAAHSRYLGYASGRQAGAIRRAQLDAAGFAGLVADIRSGRPYDRIGADWLLSKHDVSLIAIAVGIRKVDRPANGFKSRPLTPDEIEACLVTAPLARAA